MLDGVWEADSGEQDGHSYSHSLLTRRSSMRLCFCRDLGTGPGCAPPSVGSERIGSWGCRVVIAHQAYILRILGCHSAQGSQGLGPHHMQGSYPWVAISEPSHKEDQYAQCGFYSVMKHTPPTLPLWLALHHLQPTSQLPGGEYQAPVTPCISGP